MQIPINLDMRVSLQRTANMALDLFAPLKKSFNMEEAGEGEALWISPTDLAVFKRHHNDNYVNVPFWVLPSPW